MRQQERPGGYQEPSGLFKQLSLSRTGHQASLPSSQPDAETQSLGGEDTDGEERGRRDESKMGYKKRGEVGVKQ